MSRLLAFFIDLIRMMFGSKQRGGNAMGGIVVMLGGLCVVYGVLNFMGSNDTGGVNEQKGRVIKIVGGLVIVGVGFAMQHLGV